MSERKKKREERHISPGGGSATKCDDTACERNRNLDDEVAFEKKLLRGLDMKTGERGCEP